MMVEDFSGITDLEGAAVLTDEDGSSLGEWILHRTLLKLFKLSCDHQLVIAKIHQETRPMGKVQGWFQTPTPKQSR